MISKAIRPIVSLAKNAHMLRSIHNKHQSSFITQFNQSSNNNLVKTISYKFSQQKTNDPNA